MARTRLVAATFTVLLALGALPAAAASGAISDDYPAALAAAKERGVPILVDVWAPW